MATVNSWRGSLTLEKSAPADLWRNTLSRIPSVLGRLVYLASTWDNESHAYEHHGLESIFGREESDRALRSAHNRVFTQLLAFDLSEQKEDLERYLMHSCRSEAERRREVIWLGDNSGDLIPDSRDVMERNLFQADFSVLIQLEKDQR